MAHDRWIPDIQTQIVVDYLDTQWERLENLLYDTLADNHGNVTESIPFVARALKDHVEEQTRLIDNSLGRQLISAALNSIWWSNVATHYLVRAKNNP